MDIIKVAYDDVDVKFSYIKKAYMTNTQHL